MATAATHLSKLLTWHNSRLGGHEISHHKGHGHMTETNERGGGGQRAKQAGHKDRLQHGGGNIMSLNYPVLSFTVQFVITCTASELSLTPGSVASSHPAHKGCHLEEN